MPQWTGICRSILFHDQANAPARVPSGSLMATRFPGYIPNHASCFTFALPCYVLSAGQLLISLSHDCCHSAISGVRVRAFLPATRMSLLLGRRSISRMVSRRRRVPSCECHAWPRVSWCPSSGLPPGPAPPTTPAMAACPYPGHELTAWPWDLTKKMGDLGEDTNHTRVLAQSLLLARSPNDCRNPSLTLIFRLIDSRLGSHSPTPY